MPFGISRLCSIFAATALAVALIGSTAPAVLAAEYDLSTVGASATINGAEFIAYSPALAAGTGIFPSFLKISANKTVVQGYNSDYHPKPEFDEDHAHTESVLLTSCAVTYKDFGGGAQFYREFQLDIDQVLSNPSTARITLDELEVWLTDDDPSAIPYKYADGDFPTYATLVWELDDGQDNWIILNGSLSAGSGKKDLYVYIPNSIFNVTNNTYLIFYCQFGGDSTYVNNDGPEEWSRANYNAIKSGTKFNDLNANGINDLEPGLEGWTIFVDYDDDGELDFGEPYDITDADGNYVITSIAPNDPDGITTPLTWKVKEVPQAGWVQTLPASGYYEHTFTTDSEFFGNDFGNYQQATKSGTKYKDLDANGVMDGSDTGLDGWTIAAFADNDDSGTLSSGDTIAATNVTAGGGNYQLTLDPGRYIVVEQVADQAGWFESPDADTTLVNIFDTDYGQYGYDITLDSGDSETGNDFGNYQQATKSGMKYWDENEDGVNVGEAGLDGWTIAAFADNDDSDNLSAGDTLADSDVTAGGGNYQLTLEPGTYIVVEQISDQAGWVETPDDDTTPVNTYNANYGEFGYLVTLDSGDSETGNDFANYEEPSIPGTKSGTKYEDLDANGVMDGSDVGLSGWTIAAFVDDGDVADTLDGSDTPGPTTTTGVDGSYQLELQADVKYIVVEQISDQTGWLESPDLGTTLVNDATGANYNSDYGEYGYIVTLASEESEVGNNFGNYQQATKSGTKYKDLDANGVMDGSDTGLDDWTIAAFADNDDSGTLSSGDDITDTNVTAGGGNYQLTLDPGRYIVVEQVSNQSSWFESPDADTTLVNSYDSDYGQYGYDITLESGDSETGNDFGNYQQATKSGTKYEDLDANGVMNGSDAGLGGWTIAAFADNDDSDDLSAGDTLADSDVTAGSGDYELTLDPGSYIVVEQISDQGGWFESPDADTTLVNTTYANYGEYGYLVTLDSGGSETGNDFGNHGILSVIGDYVWEDLNQNGIQDEVDTGVGNITVELHHDIGGYLGSTTTDSNGYYLFGGLIPGDYYLRFIVPSGWYVSPQDQGLDDHFDSDANLNPGETIVMTLDPGEEDLTWDLGLYREPNGGVGGEAYPVNKVGILMPWIGLVMVLVGGGMYLVRRRASN
ncbi:SdrD B-like domain-containing protein [Chloroflexota bacterium]